VLSSRSYHVAHSSYYLDEDEGKAREIDLRALLNVPVYTPHGERMVRHCLLVECKKSSNKPWVFFCSPEGSYDAGFWETPFLPDIDLLDEYNVQAIRQIHPLAQSNIRGRSFYEAFKGVESNETIFGAIMTAVKATRHAVRTRFGYAPGHDLCFYYPMIVFEGDMFQATIEASATAVQPIDSCLVSFLYERPEGTARFTVPVIRENGLKPVLDSLEETLRAYGTIAATKSARVFGNQ
jgi:hypothetical protein